jgi:Xaa-Pro aminopeptidase
MIISIEPSIYREGFASRVENSLLVTADGVKVLTKAPTGIRVLA